MYINESINLYILCNFYSIILYIIFEWDINITRMRFFKKNAKYVIGYKNNFSWIFTKPITLSFIETFFVSILPINQLYYT